MSIFIRHITEKRNTVILENLKWYSISHTIKEKYENYTEIAVVYLSYWINFKVLVTHCDVNVYSF